MTTPKPLSTAAQAVLDAYETTLGTAPALAAAIRATMARFAPSPLSWGGGVMSDQFPPIPAGSTVRQNADGSWQYRSDGPWCDMPAPQKAAPWAACPSPQQPATVAPTLSDRIALAICQAQDNGPPCPAPCVRCLAMAAAAAHEIAAYFSELYGGASTTADPLDGVGTHQPEIQAGWQPIGPDKEAMAIAIARELRRPDV
jgi:hypothetical protein